MSSLAILGLLPKGISKITSGTIEFLDQNLTKLNSKAYQKIRCWVELNMYDYMCDLTFQKNIIFEKSNQKTRNVSQSFVNKLTQYFESSNNLLLDKLQNDWKQLLL